MHIDAGMVPAMVQDAPHIRTDPANVEDIVERFVNGGRGRDSVVIAIVCDVQEEESLGEAAENIEAEKKPGFGMQGVNRCPGPSRARLFHADLCPHGPVALGGNISGSKILIETAAQHFREGNIVRDFDKLRGGLMRDKVVHSGRASDCGVGGGHLRVVAHKTILSRFEWRKGFNMRGLPHSAGVAAACSSDHPAETSTDPGVLPQ